MNHLLSEKISINKKLLNDNNQLYKSLEQKNIDVLNCNNLIQELSNEVDRLKYEKLQQDKKETQILENSNIQLNKYEKVCLDNQKQNKELSDRESKIRLLETERLKLMSKLEEASYEKQNLYAKIRLQEEALNSNQKNNHELVKENLLVQEKLSERELISEKLKTEIKMHLNSIQNEKLKCEDAKNSIAKLEKIVDEKSNDNKKLLDELTNCRNLIEKLNSSINVGNYEKERLKSHIILITEQNEFLSSLLSENNEVLRQVGIKFKEVNEDSNNLLNDSMLKIENASLKMKNRVAVLRSKTSIKEENKKNYSNNLLTTNDTVEASGMTGLNTNSDGFRNKSTIQV